MDLPFPANHLEIVPVCLSKSTTLDNDIHFWDEYIGMRSCRCFLEIFYQPDQGPEKLLFLDDLECLFTELPESESTNAVGLKFASSFYVRASYLLVPATKHGNLVLAPTNQYQIRFRFAISEKGKPPPLSLHQMFGLDPSQWQPTDDFSHAPNPSLWARGYHPLASIGSGEGPATPLYRIRMEFTSGEHGTQEWIQNWQAVAWDLRIRCWWLDRDLPDANILHAEQSNLFGSKISGAPPPSPSPPSLSPPPLPPRSSRAKRECLRIQTSTSSDTLVRPPMVTWRVSRAQENNHRATARRRSKRLEAKPAVQRG